MAPARAAPPPAAGPEIDAWRAAKANDPLGLNDALARGAVGSALFDADERSALHWAAWFGCAPSCQALLKAGSAPERDRSGRSPLDLAAQANHWACVAVLADERRARSSDPDGVTALMRAAIFGARESIQVLTPWSDPRQRSQRGWSALSLAASLGWSDCLKALALWEEGPWAGSVGGPLWAAAANGKSRCVEALLSLGFDPREACGAPSKTTPAQVARANGWPGLASRLEAAAAQAEAEALSQACQGCDAERDPRRL
jgi:hypothetical protein